MNKQETSLQPGLLIFIGETGKAIYQSFRSRSRELLPAPLEYLQRPYFSMLAFVYPGEKDTYEYQFADADAYRKTGSLVEMLEYMVDVSVEEAQALKDASEDSVFDPLPSVAVIGHIQDPEMRRAVAVVHAKAATWKINCLCCCYPFELPTSDVQESVASLHTIPADLATWIEAMQLEFCYLFDDDVQDHAGVNYAVALALLALLMMNGQKKGEVSASKVGTISTCLVSVPRAIIQRACRLQVCELILENWLIENESVCEDTPAYQEIQTCVNNDVDALLKVEEELLPGANEPNTIVWWWNMFSMFSKKKGSTAPGSHTWTRFVLSDDEHSPHADTYKKLVGSTKQLFQHTTFDKEVAGSTKKFFQHFPFDNSLSPQSWLMEKEQGYKDLLGTSWPEWKNSAVKYWELQAQTTKEFLDKAFQKFEVANWSVGKIIAYADLLDKKLQEVQQVYEEKDHLYKGENTVNEEELANAARKDLYDVFIEHHQKVPSGSTLLVLGALAILSFFVFSTLLLNITMPLLSVRWVGWLIALLLPLIGIVLGNWYLLASFYLPPLQAKREIMLYYRSMIAERCKREDQKKHALIIKSIRSYINYMLSEKLRECKELFGEEARQVIGEPFRGIETTRTIYVGNKILFAQNEEFASHIFLQSMPGRENKYDAAAQKMFQKISTPGYLASVSRPCLIHNIAQLDASTAFEQKAKLRKRLATLVESLLMLNTIKDLYTVSALDPQVSNIWSEILRRINQKLWPQQKEMQDAQALILYGTDTMLTKMRIVMIQPPKQKPQEIVTTTLFPADKDTQEDNEEAVRPPEPLLSEWFLVAALYGEGGVNANVAVLEKEG